MNIPRHEHPKPQFERENWLNLNGEWDFEFDFGNSKKDAGIIDKKDWERKIIVPFCPESKLSEICDICIRLPETETFKIQELTLPVYHCIAAMLEDYFFEK